MQPAHRGSPVDRTGSGPGGGEPRRRRGPERGRGLGRHRPGRTRGAAAPRQQPGRSRPPPRNWPGSTPAKPAGPLRRPSPGSPPGCPRWSSTPSWAPCTAATACAATGSPADYTVAEPRGVAVLLTPWNDPVAVACGLIGAALVTGNTVVHKPSERCPRLGEALGEVLAPAFPPGCSLTVSGGAGVGGSCTGSGVDVIAHVGSSAAGAGSPWPGPAPAPT